jgi:hypothetical protein
MIKPVQEESAVEDPPPLGDVENPLTLSVIGNSFVGGVAGLIVMAPVVAGVPLLLGVFDLDALARFADLAIAQADALLGIVFFVVGGVLVLPLFFVVTATFLPPREPQFLRGSTISTFFWISFVYIFWPAPSVSVNATFLAVTLVSHWLYGAVLGAAMVRVTGIPEYNV